MIILTTYALVALFIVHRVTRRSSRKPVQMIAPVLDRRVEVPAVWRKRR